MSVPSVDQEILVGTLPTTFRVLAETVGGAFSIVEQTVAPGVLVWPHSHRDHDQVAIVISGALGVRVGDREWTARAGDIAVRPRHIPHTVWNAGTEPVRFLEISTPGNFEEYFERFAELAPDDALGRTALQAEFGISGVTGWAEELGARYSVAL
jgi:quercetin dioxygenase-like cupin family protein